MEATCANGWNHPSSTNSGLVSLSMCVNDTLSVAIPNNLRATVYDDLNQTNQTVNLQGRGMIGAQFNGYWFNWGSSGHAANRKAISKVP